MPTITGLSIANGWQAKAPISVSYTHLLMIILSVGISAQNPRSVFTDRPVDEAAIYFTPENFNVKTDGRMDVSDALQEALNLSLIHIYR